ncbi:neuronal-specific septin-3-like isoform X2 [Branchiostoma floridae x Branchiostoma japonicum]
MESDVATEPDVRDIVATEPEVRQIVAAVWVVTGEGVCLPDDALCAAFETADVQKRGSIDVQIVPKLVQDVLGSSLAPSEKDAIRLRAESKAKKGVLYFADFVEVMSETLQTTTQWGKLTTTLSGYVGIDTLQEQMRKKALKRGFEFHIMVVGGSGLGKSTLVNTLFKAQISRRSCTNESEGTIPKTVQIKSVSHVIEEKGVRLKLTVTDTPGFGDQINNENCWLPILEFINDQYEKYLSEEVNVSRKKHIPDTRVHVCLYFISPTGHSCRPLDLEFMKRLDKVVNIVPIIAKADTLTLEERYAFKKRVREDLEFHGIQFYPMKSLDEDEEETAINQALREKMPFAIVGSDREYQVNGKSVLGRKTKWGLIEVENKNHCEFALLRDMLIRTHMQDLMYVCFLPTPQNPHAGPDVCLFSPSPPEPTCRT